MKKAGTGLIIFSICMISFGLLSFDLLNKGNDYVWSVDKAHSSVSFEINHFFTPVEGRFNDFTIELNFDPSEPENGYISTEVIIESVNTSNEKRDSDVRSKNFFDAAKYPFMIFNSSSIKKTGDNEFAVNGNLKIKGVTREIEIPFKILGIMDHPFKKGSELMSIRSEFTVNRTDYEVGTGDWMRTNVVGDEVKIKILIEATRKK
jgi:polyisoprenoid-binding protein YceI